MFEGVSKRMREGWREGGEVNGKEGGAEVVRMGGKEGKRMRKGRVRGREGVKEGREGRR